MFPRLWELTKSRALVAQAVLFCEDFLEFKHDIHCEDIREARLHNLDEVIH